MRDCGALWSHSDYDESMGMYFSVLNHRWLLDSSIFGDDRDDLFLVPACVTSTETPVQYLVASEETLRKTHEILTAGQTCVWESSKIEPRYITQVYAKDTAPEEKVFVGELSRKLSDIPTDDDLKRSKDILKDTGLAFYLLGALNKSQVFLYMFQKDFADAN